MAKKKMQDKNPPRRVEIRGQDHLLAYITPEEAALLKARGGTGEAGPMGIPSFPEPGGTDWGGDDTSMSEGQGGDGMGGGPSDGGGDGGGFTEAELAAGRAARDAIAAQNAAVMAKAAAAPQVTQVFDDTDYGSATAQQLADVARSYIDYAGIMAPSIYSPQMVGQNLGNLLNLDTYKGLLGGKGLNLGGVPMYSSWMDYAPVRNELANLAQGQIAGRMEQAKAGYGLPGPLGAGLGKVGQFTLDRMKKELEAGGRPVFDSQGKLAGVFSKGPFGLGEVYTGTPVEGVPGTGYDMGGSESEDIKPVDEETGRCPEGYIFDEDLQACRLDTGTGIGGGGVGGIGQPIEYTPGGYARMGLLDQPPQGLLEVGGQPYDFAAANRAWRQSTATRPEYFQDPYNLTGYTLLA